VQNFDRTDTFQDNAAGICNDVIRLIEPRVAVATELKLSVANMMNRFSICGIRFCSQYNSL
jgi:hypothetical protein